MSFTTEWQVRCDFDTNRKDYRGECHVSSDPGLSKQEALERAREAGWLLRSRKHYCPNCRVIVAKFRPATE